MQGIGAIQPTARAARLRVPLTCEQFRRSRQDDLDDSRLSHHIEFSLGGAQLPILYPIISCREAASCHELFKESRRPP